MGRIFLLVFLACFVCSPVQAAEAEKEFDWNKAKWRCPSYVKLGKTGHFLIMGKAIVNGSYVKPEFLGAHENKNGDYVESGASYYAFSSSSRVVMLECVYDGFPNSLLVDAPNVAYCVVDGDKRSVRAACWEK